jgi:UDP-2,3-diacylglucosamine pyrophosphatase LpxH
MLSIQDLADKAGGKLNPYRDMRGVSSLPLTERLVIAIPDMHLLEKRATDDFFDGKQANVDRFEDLLYFFQDVRKEGHEFNLIQLGDMYDLWQAKGNTNLIVAAYPNIIGNMDDLGTTYIIGNHDIGLWQWYSEQGQRFNRLWRMFENAEGKPRIVFEHGFQADFWNREEKDRISTTVGEGVARVIGFMEYLYPDIDVVLGEAWDSLSRSMSLYNGAFTPVKNEALFKSHEYTDYYVRQMEKFNSGATEDQHQGTDLVLSVIGHTHRARLVSRPKEDRTFYLMDCGSWVNGRHEIGIIAGKEFGVFTWG